MHNCLLMTNIKLSNYTYGKIGGMIFLNKLTRNTYKSIAQQ